MPLITNLDAKIYGALRDRLATMSGGYYINEPGDTYDPPANTAFLLTDDVRFDPDRPYTNTDAPDWHTGSFMVAVITPATWTHMQRMGIVGLIRDHFHKDLRLTYSDLNVKIRETPFVAGSAYRDDAIGMMRVPVEIRWRAWG